MGKKLLLLGAALIGAVATVPALAHRDAPEAAIWRPVTTGLTRPAAEVLPKTINPAHPVRVVSSALDDAGRPVATAHTATDRASATKLVRDGQHARRAIGVELDGVVTAADVPTGTDDLRAQQWDLDTMRVAGAWPASTGAGVTVAVIDTGVASGHPDLAGQVLPGADLLAGTEGPATDPNGHGTHVAGIIAAATGNGEGIAGIAPGARILPVRVLGANGSGYLSDTANGIVYAADHGADVINLSLSATSQLDAVTNAIAYARNRGVVVVAAAGNARGSGSPVSYPGADPGVIAVAATDQTDAVAYYSTAGGYVDVAAPGSGILSTFPSGYRSMSGTSMAAPHVAALAALIRGADRTLGPDQVEQVIESSAVDLGAPGRDSDYGYGRVDAAAALAALTPTPAPSSDSPEPSGTPTPTDSPTPTDPPTPIDSPTPTPIDSLTPSDTPPPPSDAPTSADPPAPAATVRIYAVRTGPGQLLIALDGLDGQTVEVQQEAGADWTTVLTYPATRVMRLTDLVPGVAYRVVVSSTARVAGATRGPVRL